MLKVLFLFLNNLKLIDFISKEKRHIIYRLDNNNDESIWVDIENLA